MTVIVEMVSDLACPWCWLGLRRLKRAVEEAAGEGIAVDVRFRPYELDPSIPPGGHDYKAYMRQRFGSEDDAPDSPERSRARQMRDALEAYGEAEGVPFNFDAITRRANTLDAHRCVRWAEGQGLGWAMKEALFAANFRDGRDIGDAAVLAEIAGAVGLDAEIVAKLLSSRADETEVRQEEALFMEMGVRGVPTFIANRRYAIQGAEDVAALKALIVQAAQALPEERGVS